MSATTPTRYLPTGRVPDTAVDIDYAQIFIDLAEAIDGCERSDDVAVLLSTCRNHWLTTNAAFLDLKRAAGSGDLPDSVSIALYELDRNQPQKAIEPVNKASEYVGYAANKLAVWDNREALLEELEASAAKLKELSPARVIKLLQDQRENAHAPESPDHMQYLVLSMNEEPSCMERVRTLKGVVHTLERTCVVIKEVATLQAAHQGSLFEQEADADSPPPRLIETLTADMVAWEMEGVEGSTVRFGPGLESEVDLATVDSENWPAFLRHLAAVSKQHLETVQRELSSFNANVATPPMPEPFIVDLTPKHFTGTAKEYEVESHRAPEPPTPNHTKVALLKWGIPDEVFNQTELCRFERPGFVDEAGDVIRTAVTTAAEGGAAYVVLPEICVPEEAVDELGRLSEETGIGIIAGKEHWAERDAKTVNEALIYVPRIAHCIHQRKQEPSAAEHLEERFAADRKIKIIRGTALGTLMVAVCSDYLEHDIVTRAWMDEHVDTLVVCARNGNPSVFERLAMGDSIREFCNVIVVNAFPGDEEVKASGAGTLVAVPHRDEPLLPLEEVDLQVTWSPAANPTLAFVDLNMKAISSRSHNRSDHGYIRPPRFATR